jgi:hypothetical protein
MGDRSTTLETDFQSNRDSFAAMERRISAIAESFDGKLERILSDLEKMTQLVKQPDKKYISDQRAFTEGLFECFVPWNRSLSARSVTRYSGK